MTSLGHPRVPLLPCIEVVNPSTMIYAARVTQSLLLLDTSRNNNEDTHSHVHDSEDVTVNYILPIITMWQSRDRRWHRTQLATQLGRLSDLGRADCFMSLLQDQ